MGGVDYLKFIAGYRGEHSDKRKRQLLDRFELDPRGKIKKMSKGMKQKIGIVAAFMHDPDVLILDEPTRGLDPLMQSRVVEPVAEERGRGKTILMSSHMFEEVERTCHRIGIIRDGRLVAVDTVDALRERHMRTYAVTLPDEKTAADFATDFKGKANGREVAVTASMSLEDIFMQYYGREGK
jgi:ABC-2 type transport system ATP-binding protein